MKRGMVIIKEIEGTVLKEEHIGFKDHGKNTVNMLNVVIEKY